MAVQYLQYPEDFYCVSANYTITSNSTIGVFNYDTFNETNGPVQGGCLCAVIPDLSVPSKLEVGPCFIPKRFYGI
jgi:hypothetical protein